MTIDLDENDMSRISDCFGASTGNETALAVWVVGRPAAGKTTTATLLCERLRGLNRAVRLVDGEAVRQIFDRRLGYSKSDRLIALKRLIHVNRVLQARGVIPVTATICGLRDFQELVRASVANVRFMFLDCPLHVAAERDPKGFYAGAKRGEIKDFFGVDIDFEAPVQCALRIDSGELSPAEVVARILRRLEEDHSFSPARDDGRIQLQGR